MKISVSIIFRGWLSVFLSSTLFLWFAIIGASIENILSALFESNFSGKSVQLILLYESLRIINIVAPFSFALSVSYIIGKLYAENTLTILQLAGLSPYKILGIFLIPAIIIALLALGNRFYLQPTIIQTVSENEKKHHLSILDLVSPKQFSYLPSGVVMYIDNFDNEKQEANNVFVSMAKSNDDGEYFDVTFAKKAYQYALDDGREYLTLTNGKLHQMDNDEKGEQQVITFEKMSYKVPRSQLDEALQRRSLSFEEMLNSDDELVRQLLWNGVFSSLIIPIGVFFLIPLSRLKPKESQYLAFKYSMPTFILLNICVLKSIKSFHSSEVFLYFLIFLAVITITVGLIKIRNL